MAAASGRPCLGHLPVHERGPVLLVAAVIATHYHARGRMLAPTWGLEGHLVRLVGFESRL